VIDRVLLSVWTYRLVRFVLGGIFIWAGITKLIAPWNFAGLISQYGLVPDEFLVPTALGLPALELVAGFGLLLDVRVSLEVISGLLLLFIAVLWFGILKNLDVDCGCFSLAEKAEHATLRTAMYRDLVLGVQILYLFWWRWRHARVKGKRT